jgi:hypothetical protein
MTDDKTMDPMVAKLPKWAQAYIEHLRYEARQAKDTRDDSFNNQQETPVWWKAGQGAADEFKRYVNGAPTGCDPKDWPHGQYIRVYFRDKNNTAWSVGFDTYGDLSVRGDSHTVDYHFQPESRGCMTLVSCPHKGIQQKG